ncbi:MAG: Sec-independent protein translocase protein TatB [Pseudomonadota bacterium]|nr:Sec-independent protein translocase protein TatB [Pseudomonadota bacterium]
MFEISFPELVILGVIALLVLGPDRLPKAARFAGLWVRRARAQWHSVKTELEREMADDELRHNLEATRKALAEAESQLHAQVQDLQATVEHATPAHADDHNAGRLTDHAGSQAAEQTARPPANPTDEASRNHEAQP